MFSGCLFGYYRAKFAGRDELLRELMNTLEEEYGRVIREKCRKIRVRAKKFERLRLKGKDYMSYMIFKTPAYPD